MTDIVEWLQNTAVVRGPDMGGRYREAAAEIKRLRAAYDSRGGEMDSMRMVLAETQKWNENRLAEIERLRSLLDKLHWKSIDKDNMEFRCDTTCYVMDEIRAALEPKP